MLIIPVKEGENIERAIKKFKKKFERTGTMKELRERQKFTKPSVRRRQEVLRAIYRDKIRSEA
jgi:small subunit ribosomal protein S21